jgi:hypothetical protein
MAGAGHDLLLAQEHGDTALVSDHGTPCRHICVAAEVTLTWPTAVIPAINLSFRSCPE